MALQMVGYVGKWNNCLNKLSPGTGLDSRRQSFIVIPTRRRLLLLLLNFSCATAN